MSQVLVAGHASSVIPSTTSNLTLTLIDQVRFGPHHLVETHALRVEVPVPVPTPTPWWVCPEECCDTFISQDQPNDSPWRDERDAYLIAPRVHGTEMLPVPNCESLHPRVSTLEHAPRDEPQLGLARPGQLLDVFA